MKHHPALLTADRGEHYLPRYIKQVVVEVLEAAYDQPQPSTTLLAALRAYERVIRRPAGRRVRRTAAELATFRKEYQA